jgi:CRP-like cAMP-binding protein
VSRDVANRVGLEIFVRSFLGLRPPERVMRQLAGMLREIDLPKGTVMFERGAPPNEIFMIQEGQVALVGEDDSRWTFEDQSMLGVVDATLGRPYQRTAVVERRVIGAKVRFADYLEVLEDDFDFTRAAFERATHVAYETGLRLGPENVFPPPSETELLGNRSDDDRPLEMVEKLEVLHRSQLLLDAPVQPLVSLANAAEEVRLDDGDVLFSIGDRCDAIYTVATGMVKAERTDPDVRARFGPGDLVSGGAALSSERHLLDARALSKTRVLRITKEDLYDVMEDHFGVVRAVFSYGSRDNARVRSLLEEIQPANLERQAG